MPLSKYTISDSVCKYCRLVTFRPISCKGQVWLSQATLRMNKIFKIWAATFQSTVEPKLPLSSSTSNCVTLLLETMSLYYPKLCYSATRGCATLLPVTVPLGNHYVQQAITSSCNTCACLCVNKLSLRLNRSQSERNWSRTSPSFQ